MTTQVTHNNIKQSTGYVAKFGNQINCISHNPEKESLQKFWKRCLLLSQSKAYGDVTLYKNGKSVRWVWNADNRITSNEYPTTYAKPLN